MKLISLLKKLPRFSTLRPLSKKDTPNGWIPLWWASVLNVTIAYWNLLSYYLVGNGLNIFLSVFALLTAVGGLVLIKYMTQKAIMEKLMQQRHTFSGTDGDGTSGI